MSQNDLTPPNIENLIAQERLLAGKLWRGSKQATQTHTSIVDSGHSTLNQNLHSGGWPLTTTTELGLSQPGIGELRLLIPAMRELQQQHSQQNIIWIAPPFLPYAPALSKEHIDVSKLAIIQSNTIKDTLWAAEQSLLAECCAAVFCWTGTHNLTTRELRRLQLASEKSKTWNVLFRHSDCLKQPSSAGLRIHLQANTHSKLDLHILKQPNGWGGQHCTLSLHPHYENWQRLPAHLLPHNNQPQTRVLPEQLETLGNNNHQHASVTVLTPLSALKTVH